MSTRVNEEPLPYRLWTIVLDGMYTIWCLTLPVSLLLRAFRSALTPDPSSSICTIFKDTDRKEMNTQYIERRTIRIILMTF